MNYLNKALDTFNTAVVSPIYYVFFTTLTIIASAILFQGWSSHVRLNSANPAVPSACTEGNEGFHLSDFVTTLCGFVTIVVGVTLLHLSRKEPAGGTEPEVHSIKV